MMYTGDIELRLIAKLGICAFTLEPRVGADGGRAKLRPNTENYVQPIFVIFVALHTN